MCICMAFACHRRNILKISLFYGDIKFSEFKQFEAYDVKTLLGAYTLLYSLYGKSILILHT